jgi:hypothetical protein
MFEPQARRRSSTSWINHGICHGHCGLTYGHHDLWIHVLNDRACMEDTLEVQARARREVQDADLCPKREAAKVPTTKNCHVFNRRHDARQGLMGLLTSKFSPRKGSGSWHDERAAERYAAG